VYVKTNSAEFCSSVALTCLLDCLPIVSLRQISSSGNAGAVIDALLHQGFDVSAAEMLTIDKMAAEEFLEVYKGVVPEYSGMVESVTAGPCIAIEICGENSVETVREFVGPTDPEIARHIRPRSLRARFGVDKLCNGVHCTDLPEDGVLEVQTIFVFVAAIE
jgi:nucleoside-diphosphate kinase